MVPIFRNRIRLWWHCLVHFHRDYNRDYRIGFIDKDDLYPKDSIGCLDCDYKKEEL